MMKSAVLLSLIMMLSIQNGFALRIDNSGKGVEQPKFISKNTAEKFINFKVVRKSDKVTVKWETDAASPDKEFFLLKGVKSDNNQIKWQIVKAYQDAGKASMKMKYVDGATDDSATYYRLMVRENDAKIHYTNIYE